MKRKLLNWHSHMLLLTFLPWMILGGSAADAHPLKIDYCSNVDVSDSGGSFAPIANLAPSTVQFGGSCAYHAASQLFDAIRVNERRFRNNLSSPLEINYRIKNRKGAKNLSAGRTDEVLKTLFEEGSCPRNLNSANGSDDSEKTYHALFVDFQSLISLFYPSLSTSIDAQKIAMIDLNFYQRLRVALEKIRSNPNYTHFQNMNRYPNLDVLWSAIYERDFISFIRELAPPSCRENEKIRNEKNHSLSITQFLKTESYLPLFKEIHKELNRGSESALPVVVHYCSKVLLVGPGYNTMAKPGTPACGDHASLIIGRRRNPTTGACQLLLRNTWGKDDCERKTWECKPGTSHLWMDEAVFKNALHTVIRVKRN